jgi:TonB family protein
MSKPVEKPIQCHSPSKASNHTGQVKLGNFNFINPRQPNDPIKEDYWYHVKGVNSNAITRKELNGAVAIHEFIPNYPVNWIENYKSITLIASKGQHETRMALPGVKISDEMKQLFSSVETNTDLHFKVEYTTRNSITDELDAHEFNYWATLVPHKQARFKQGNDSLIHYLREQTEAIVREKYHDYLGLVGVQFEISTEGKVTNVRLKESSKNEAFDAFMMKAIRDLPSWEPAVDENGKKVVQEFEFILSLNGC